MNFVHVLLQWLQRGSVAATQLWQVLTMFQVLLRDQWADAVVWPLVQKAHCGVFRAAGRQSAGCLLQRGGKV